MPTMWYVKNGRRPDTQHGPGIEISFEEVAAIFVDHDVKFVSNDAPNINPDAPSEHPVNVVIEVDREEGTSTQLERPGFYLVVGLSPEQTQYVLGQHRGSA